ncbi:phenylacetic acid degradation operon negative regulatory protein PaaX [Pusillimonas sp. MFBS29]|uniref:phenylacetic acid degradation operon negative regulatory protein PaaX n=1 Tax=Pusillimonas sp. MFBS29 TaxID=2886690 RepID=UPI001D122EBA|nr:phenylacetic acid degradation operon negative regulatory protein PaaX [Pusillimonas sp. MFBS29]MCC2595274.1 phenylacetic acid degradation operon negative regulatory protein PaaX [Pusillimonas sp. MFBS29]
MADTQHSLEDQIRNLLATNPPRAKSLCVTLLGDAIEPHGGSIWLSKLIELVTPLGVNERLLRTSVFRLVAQDWLQSERHGRRSLYRLSPLGRELTEQASGRIYDGSSPVWEGDWTLVVLPRFGNASLSKRGEVRRELIWAGFGAIAPGIFALPRNQTKAAHKVLGKLKLSGHALVLGAHEMNEGKGLLITELVSQCWDLDGVAGQYQGFLDTFGPMLAGVNSDMRPAQAYTIRALAFHEWRRIVLHDPQLPAQMLPQDWPGHPARQLCGALYWRVFDQAEVFLDELLGQDPEHYRALRPEVFKRFGGRNRTPGVQAA